MLLRSNRVRVDIPVGYAEFPDFAFGVADTDIPCGGFLSLIPNKYDLRLPEIAFHIQDPIVRETYGISDSAERFLIAAGTDAAGMLRFYHRMGVTHTFPHWMNFKVGVLDEDFKAWYALQDGHDTPATTICDLDACCYPNQDNHIFLANAMNDLEVFLNFPLVFNAESIREEESDRPDYDDVRRYHALMQGLKGRHPMLRGLASEVMAAYFDTNPTDPRISTIDPSAFTHWAESSQRIWEWNEEGMSFLLRQMYDLGTRGYTMKPFNPDELRY